VFEDYLGFSESQILGKTDYDFVAASVADGWREKDRLAMQAGQLSIEEQEVVFAHDGHKALIETRKIPMHDAHGQVIGLMGIGRDITAFRQAEQRLRKSHDVLRALAAHKQTEREQVHKELAYKIHEDLAQNLAALRINLSLLEECSYARACAAEVKTMNEITQHCITRIRDIVTVLRPTVLDLGLVPALDWLIEDFKGIGFQFDVALQEDIDLSDEAATVLFRAAQEALLNVALHAGATRIWVTLDAVQANCRLRIRDNGCGFDSTVPYPVGQFGLIGLTEQVHHLGGGVLIHSKVGQGTVVTIQVPISEQMFSL
jgi:PAS domain S-box-containing protein